MPSGTDESPQNYEFTADIQVRSDSITARYVIRQEIVTAFSDDIEYSIEIFPSQLTSQFRNITNRISSRAISRIASASDVPQFVVENAIQNQVNQITRNVPSRTELSDRFGGLSTELTAENPATPPATGRQTTNQEIRSIQKPEIVLPVPSRVANQIDADDLFGETLDITVEAEPTNLGFGIPGFGGVATGDTASVDLEIPISEFVEIQEINSSCSELFSDVENSINNSISQLRQERRRLGGGPTTGLFDNLQRIRTRLRNITGSFPPSREDLIRREGQIRDERLLEEVQGMDIPTLEEITGGLPISADNGNVSLPNEDAMSSIGCLRAFSSDIREVQNLVSDIEDDLQRARNLHQELLNLLEQLEDRVGFNECLNVFDNINAGGLSLGDIRSIEPSDLEPGAASSRLDDVRNLRRRIERGDTQIELNSECADAILSRLNSLESQLTDRSRATLPDCLEQPAGNQLENLDDTLADIESRVRSPNISDEADLQNFRDEISSDLNNVNNELSDVRDAIQNVNRPECVSELQNRLNQLDINDRIDNVETRLNEISPDGLPEFNLRDFSLNFGDVINPGDRLNLEVLFENAGDVRGQVSAPIEINGNRVATINATLPAGATGSRNVRISAPSQPGRFSLSIANQQQSFTVEEQETEPDFPTEPPESPDLPDEGDIPDENLVTDPPLLDWSTTPSEPLPPNEGFVLAADFGNNTNETKVGRVTLNRGRQGSGGREILTRTFTLPPDGTTVRYPATTPPEPGQFWVTLGDTELGIEVEEDADTGFSGPQFELRDFRILDEQPVPPGEDVQFGWTIANAGNEEDRVTADMQIDGQSLQQISAFLGPGETAQNNNPNIIPGRFLERSGVHTITIDGNTELLRVREDIQQPDLGLDDVPSQLLTALESFETAATQFIERSRNRRTANKKQSLIGEGENVRTRIRSEVQDANPAKQDLLSTVNSALSSLRGTATQPTQPVGCENRFSSVAEEIESFENMILELSAPINPQELQEVNQQASSLEDSISNNVPASDPCREEFITRVTQSVQRAQSLVSRVRIEVPEQSGQQQQREELLQELVSGLNELDSGEDG